MISISLITACTKPGFFKDKESPLAVKLKAALLTEDYSIIKEVRLIPAEVQQIIGRLADPGKMYNSTDFIIDFEFPNKGMVFGGVGKNISFVHYNQGGLSLQAKLLIAELQKSKVIHYCMFGKRSYARLQNDRQKDQVSQYHKTLKLDLLHCK